LNKNNYKHLTIFIFRIKNSKQINWICNIDKGFLCLIVIFVLTIPVFTPRIYATDEIEYFSYLPAILLDHTVNFTNEYTYFYNSNPKVYITTIKRDLLDKHNENDLPINVGPIGSALMWSPFYLIAHGIVTLAQVIGFKVQADGYSFPYVLAVTLSSLVYGFFGLLMSYWLAAQFVPKFYAALATVVIWLASPVIFYMSVTPPMSHSNSLFAISLFLFIWYRTRGWNFDEAGQFVFGQRDYRWWLILGLSGGLMMMVREQDGSVMLVAVLESMYLYYQNNKIVIANIKTTEYIKILPACQIFLKNLLFVLGVLIGLTPQLLVYQLLNGHFGPSNTVVNKLEFLTPQSLLQFVLLMFDQDHGMYMWSPVLLISTIGLIVMLQKRRIRFYAVIFFMLFLLELYISASFKTWTMAGSFGARRLVGISPIFIIGLAYLTSWLGEKKHKWYLRKKWLIAISIIFIAWNFGVIIQFAIRTPLERQNLNIIQTVTAQFTEVPNKIFTISQDFLLHRDRFYKK